MDADVAGQRRWPELATRSGVSEIDHAPSDVAGERQQDLEAGIEEGAAGGADHSAGNIPIADTGPRLEASTSPQRGHPSSPMSPAPVLFGAFVPAHLEVRAPPLTRQSPTSTSESGTLATRVSGGTGQDRLLTFYRGIAIVLLFMAPVWLLGMIWSLLWLFASLTVVFPVCIFLYNIFMIGPWRCVDVSMPVYFDLTVETLTVSTWHLRPRFTGTETSTARLLIWFCHVISCCRCTMQWPAAQLQTVEVYKQTDNILPPTPIHNPEQVLADLSWTMCPLGKLFSLTSSRTCAFLGARIDGVADVLPLSKQVWNESEIPDLFRLALSTRLFRAGELYVNGVGGPLPTPPVATTAARDSDIAALPVRVHSRELLPEIDYVECDCAICLTGFDDGNSIRKLPCGHEFHAECAEHWLRVCGVCPLCKQGIRSNM